MRTTRSPPTSLTPPRTTRRPPRCWTRLWPIPQTTPEQTLADAGYFGQDNVNTAAERGTDPLIATGRLKHGEQVPDAPRGRIRQERHRQATHGPQATDQEGQGRLRQTQG